MQNDHAVAKEEKVGEPGVQQAIRQLITQQPFGVLCTQGHGQPYGSLVAIAANDELTSFVFATPEATRKHRLLTECDCVALFVDSRSSHPEDFMKVDAFTATGKAVRLSSGSEFDCWSTLLLQRHPYQRAMVESPSSALFRIDVVRYFYVRRFQEVTEWVPTKV